MREMLARVEGGVYFQFVVTAANLLVRVKTDGERGVLMVHSQTSNWSSPMRSVALGNWGTCQDKSAAHNRG
jgi:hypothetical protein